MSWRQHKLIWEQWATSANLEQFFEVLEGVLLSTGMIVLNPAYKPDACWRKGAKASENKQACKIIIVKQESLASTDETGETTNMSGGGLQWGKQKERGL